MMIKDLIHCHFNDALHHLNQANYGSHLMIIYPDLDTLRELYSNYIHKQIEDNNEIVLVNPFYETADSVRRVLSEKFNHGMDATKYEEENVLMIADSLQEYLGNQPYKYFKQSLSNCTEMKKNGLSVLSDLGAYNHRYMHDDLVDHESSLSTKDIGVPMKGFCLYHQKDFGRFSDEQQQKLIKHHDVALKMIKA
ncbi:MAG: MEDS domain-containing protein [Nitrososphaeraceae archaeon]|nr:MEDS domain-containing protein [Nitrososphaeraceae archaeon]